MFKDEDASLTWNQTVVTLETRTPSAVRRTRFGAFGMKPAVASAGGGNGPQSRACRLAAVYRTHLCTLGNRLGTV